MLNRPSKIVLFFALVVCLATVAACRQTPVPPPTVSAPLELMPLETKRSQLPTGFPVEVPVPNGTLGKSGRQGQGVWVYELRLDVPLDTAVLWYEQAYSAANWTEAERSVEGGSARLLFKKGHAETEVRLAASGARTNATVAIGIGVPVGQTY